ncbi:MAG: class I SAM-dependent methyltransferase [Oscillospiraceae bacterium]|jgi:SAM-dependent methyltransferase|nr:class I SAM-dependent methyltransferase [Oscillospiraceae bacterium]
MPYGSLAARYDGLMSGFDYEAYADYLLSFAGERRRVLDLACGTGRLAEILSRRGCDVTAADASPEMLAVAQNRDCRNVLFLLQDMAELDLYGTVEAVFCTLDALNYLQTPQKLKETFRRVRLFLEPGGVFVFDVLTPEALSSRDGAVFMSDSEDAYCVWNCAWKAPFCRQEITLFSRRGENLWERHEEVHTERAYRLSFIEGALAEAGFASVRQYGMLSKDPPGKHAERVVFAAK